MYFFLIKININSINCYLIIRKKIFKNKNINYKIGVKI